MFLRVQSFFQGFGEFCKIHEFGTICEIHELWETHRFCDCCSGTAYAIGSSSGERTVLCIACCAYSLVVAVVLIFPLLSY